MYFSNHIIGQLINDFNNAPLSNKIYLIVSLGFYLFQYIQIFIFVRNIFLNIKYK